jgi:hypothetical protein
MALALAWSKSTIAAGIRSLLVFDYILYYVACGYTEVTINFSDPFP